MLYKYLTIFIKFILSPVILLFIIWKYRTHKKLVEEIIVPLIVHQIELQESSGAFMFSSNNVIKVSLGTQALIQSTERIIKQLESDEDFEGTISGWDINFIKNNSYKDWLMKKVLNKKIRIKIEQFDQLLNNKMEEFDNYIERKEQYEQRIMNSYKHRKELIQIALEIKIKTELFQTLLQNNIDMFHYYFCRDK